MKHFSLGMLLTFVAWAPIVVWQTAPEWGPKILGPAGYENLAHSSLGTGLAVAAIVVTAGTFLTGMYLLMGPVLGTMFGIGAEARIRKTGRPAKGILKALNENSGGGIVTINDQPYLNLTVEVHDGFTAPRVVSFDAIVPRTLLPQLVVGVEVPIKVDPQDPNKVVSDW